MKDQYAQQLLAQVMGWRNEDIVLRYVPSLQLLADYKYDHYQRFRPGKRFIESLAHWLNQFAAGDRQTALQLVTDRLIFISEGEFSHLVQTAYPDLIVQERLRLVAEELDIPAHRIGYLRSQPRLNELKLKSLYLGLSDGARTNELRRASEGDISNGQIWHAYELGQDKSEEMLGELATALQRAGIAKADPRFSLIWLLDDFSGSGNTYIRYDKGKYKGKIRKIYERLSQGRLVDPAHYEVFLLLYVATRKAIDHIEYWAERFTSDNGYHPLHVRVLWPLEHDVALRGADVEPLKELLMASDYYDERVFDVHLAVGGTTDVRLGFAGCALPVVLAHNTPNNSVFVLWGPEDLRFNGLFPRVSRYREF